MTRLLLRVPSNPAQTPPRVGNRLRHLCDSSAWKGISSCNFGWNRSPHEQVIVISGISGRFPKSANMAEFQANLFSGLDMSTASEVRWGNEGGPKRFGFLYCLDKFDAAFFKLTPRQAQQLDPQVRLLMEASFEAIVDAGFSPSDLQGKRTGVFCAAIGSDASVHSQFRYDKELAGYMAFSHQSFVIPARIAFAFDFQGPSSHVSTACSSSLTAIETAVNHIRLGNIDTAIVTGSHVLMNPRAHVEYTATGAVSMDGQCRSFDESATGFVRSEAAVAILIQRREYARRSYARIVNICSNTDGFKHTGLAHPSGKKQAALFQATYEQAGMDPAKHHLAYIEAHGSGTPAGDSEELCAISNAFCASSARKLPLLIGSVKSNMGHSEPAAGLSGVAKVIVAIQTGTIPGNLHFDKPRAELRSLMDAGKLKVVTENTPLEGGLIGINSFGIGGTNAHLVLDPGENTRQETHDAQRFTELPVLIPFAGRTESQVRESLQEAITHSRNPDYVYLLQSAFGTHIPGLQYRGYSLLAPGKEAGENICHESIKALSCDSSSHLSVCVIFPGLGTQWVGMGKELMHVEPFAASIQRSRTVIKSVGLDLDWLLPGSSSFTFHDGRQAYVARVAIQIALWDTLQQALPRVGIDYFIGHSDGELICAYADGCFTAEETLLVADARARACRDGCNRNGAMASIGMSPEETISRLPPCAQIACFNSPRNVTIAGEKEAVAEFVQQLESEEKLAVMLNCYGLACHTGKMYEVAELFMKYTNGLISGTKDRARSSRWVSTCFQADYSLSEAPQWGNFASAEYFKHNMCLPVLFDDALKNIPRGSVVIELTTMECVQSFLKDSLLHQNYVHIVPMKFKADDRLCHFYESIGEMYTAGLDVDMMSLYPKVPRPVPATTPFISPLIKWDHTQSWKTHVMKYPLEAGYETTVDLRSPNHALIEGHKVEDSTVYPATGYIYNVWTHFADALGLEFESTPVSICNMKFEKAKILRKGQHIDIFSVLLTGSGRFELKSGSEVLVCGEIKLLEASSEKEDQDKRTSSETPSLDEELPQNSSTWLPLAQADIYKELGLRGLNYSGDFRGLEVADPEGRWTESCWKGNWIAFLDTLLQSLCLSSLERHLPLPVEIEKIQIDPQIFRQHIEKMERKIVRVNVDPIQKTISCPGVEIKSVCSTIAPRKNSVRGNLGYDRHTFCPFIQDKSDFHLEATFREMVDLVLENSSQKRLRVVDIFTQRDNSVAKLFTDFMKVQLRHEASLLMMTLANESACMEENHKNLGILVTKDEIGQLIPNTPTTDLIVVDTADNLPALAAMVPDSGFILGKFAGSAKSGVYMPKDLVTVSEKISQDIKLALFRKKKPQNINVNHFPICQHSSNDFEWVQRLQTLLSGLSNMDEGDRVYVTAQNEQTSGIIGFIKCLLKEVGHSHLRCIFDPESRLDLNFKKPCHTLRSIIEKDLVLNVVKDNKLGSYRLVPLEATEIVKNTTHAFAAIQTPGDLSTLRWVQSPLMPYYPSKRIAEPEQYKIAFSAINFHDALVATGSVPIMSEHSFNGPNLGVEFSGCDANGNRVMGIGEAGMIATFGWADPNFVWPVPEHWTLEEAATVPVAYSTALYALFIKGRLEPGQSLLVHAGTGGVGQAAITLALAHGCEVFTTVGSSEKREFMKKRFPKLKDDHIGNSRSTNFEKQFLEVTNGRGVDVVLNSLEGKKLIAGVRCLANNGKFLEIGVCDAQKNMTLGMRPLLKNVEFIGAGIQQMHSSPEQLVGLLSNTMKDALATGAVQPITRHVFQPDQLEEAFRFMTRGKHMGKVILKMCDENSSGGEFRIAAKAQTYFSRDKIYIVAGGLGGFGLEVADWMIQRGARHIILTSRSGVVNGYQSLCLRRWRTMYAAIVETPIVDLSKLEEAEGLFKALCTECKTSEVGGIFNCAMVLQDDDFRLQNKETFTKVVAPKAILTENLDILSRKYCPSLDYFVAFSSQTGVRGSLNQTNYGWANSALDRVCEKRSREGLHAVAIQWGFVGQVGYSFEKILARASNLESLDGYAPQRIESCLETLDNALQQVGVPIISSILVAPKQDFHRSRQEGVLVSKVKNIFGIPNMASIDSKTTLSQLGLDSMITFELNQIFLQEFQLSLSKEKFRMLTVGDLKAIDEGTYAVGS